MPHGSANYPAQGHMRIDDSWIVANASDNNACINCQYPDGDPDYVSTSTGRAGQPRGIIFRGDGTDGNSAVIRGFLWDENAAQTDDYYLTSGSVHPLRFKRIYAQGTTARGIKVLY